MFLLFITLSQYFILLLRQPVSFSDDSKGESTMEVWAFLLNLINSTYFSVANLELFSLKLFGPLQITYNKSTTATTTGTAATAV